MPRVDQEKLQQEYRGHLTEAVRAIRTEASQEQPVDESLRDELLAMTVPADFKELHLALVRLISEEEDSRILLAQINEVVSPYPWLNN